MLGTCSSSISRVILDAWVIYMDVVPLQLATYVKCIRQPCDDFVDKSSSMRHPPVPACFVHANVPTNSTQMVTVLVAVCGGGS